MKNFKKWYKNLYRGERYLVDIFIVITIVAMLLWATHDYVPKTVRKQIIMNRY
jgi:hypothetical protein